MTAACLMVLVRQSVYLDILPFLRTVPLSNVNRIPSWFPYHFSIFPLAGFSWSWLCAQRGCGRSKLPWMESLQRPVGMHSLFQLTQNSNHDNRYASGPPKIVRKVGSDGPGESVSNTAAPRLKRPRIVFGITQCQLPTQT